MLTDPSMHIVDAIKNRLEQVPYIKYMIEDNAITVFPATAEGFEVSLHDNENFYLVNFGDWHEVFKNEEEALEYFIFGLSNNCRLKVYYRGEVPYRWIVEARDGVRWKKENKLRLFFYPFWREQKIVYLQNHLLAPR